jgi:pimeloyl-ACP methyl ester carboxylesterase
MPRQQLVDVGGYRLVISVAGSGSPPLVFVSGRGGGEGEWADVRAVTGTPTAQVTYSRPALGGSDPLPAVLASVPRAPSWAAAQLRTLLDQVGVSSPRVLVAHSLGGLIAEAYAARWPEETAGLVLVDPSDPRANVLFRSPTPADEEPGGICFSMQASADERAAFPPLALPAVVVSSAVGRWLRVDDPSIFAPLTHAEIDERWQEFQRDWATRTGAVQLIAHSAGHLVHEEAPQLIARAVEAVVAAAQDGGPVRVDPAVVEEAGGRLATTEHAPAPQA